MDASMSPQIIVKMRRTGAGQPSKSSALGSFGKHSLQGGRSYQEDRVVACELPNLGGAVFAGVYDGHVGEKASEFCVSRLHEILAQKLTGGTNDYEAALTKAFQETNEVFLAQPGEDVSGTTACVMLRVRDTLYVANAGDSRCVVFGSDGPCQISTDHRPDDAAEYARIEAAGGELFDPEDGVGSRVCGPAGAMLACSRSIGDRHFKPVVTCEPDIFQRPIGTGDAFAILASDGVWDEVSNLKACNLVASVLETGSAQDAAVALCDAAEKAGSEDNISAIVVTLSP